MKIPVRVLCGIGCAVVIILALHLYDAYDLRDVLASKIRSGDVSGVADLIASHPKLIEKCLDWQTKLVPLDLAASLRQEMICSNLIAAGADVNSRNEVGETPLFFASRCLDTNILVMLLKHGANVSATNINGQTVLHYLTYTDDTNVIKLLLGYGADPAQKDRDGKSPLDYAHESKKDDIVATFVKAMSR